MDVNEIKEEIKHRKELTKTHSTRLKVLEKKAAKYGINIPAEIEVEIVELKKKIRFENRKIKILENKIKANEDGDTVKFVQFVPNHPYIPNETHITLVGVGKFFLGEVIDIITIY